MGERPLTIGLLWHSACSDNLGVGALTVSQIAIVEAAARTAGVSVNFVILGWRDARAPYVTHENLRSVLLSTRDLVRPGGLWAAVRQCDLVLDIGAGDSFSDIYGVRRFLLMTLAKVVVLVARKPLILSPQTIGPFSRSWVQMIAGAVMHRCKAVLTRDGLSTRFLTETRQRGVVTEATDVALCLPHEPPSSKPDNLVRVGINVSGLLFNGGYTGKNMFELACDYPTMIRDLIDRLQADGGIEVHLIGHVLSEDQPIEDDYRIALQLAKEFPGTVVAPRFGSPSEAKTYIAGMDVFTGARMHACIAAFSSGVPVIPMAYSRKFAGLFGSLGYDHTVDCRSESSASVLNKVEAGIATRTALAEQIRTCMASGLARLAEYEALIADNLRQIALK